MSTSAIFVYRFLGLFIKSSNGKFSKGKRRQASAPKVLCISKFSEVMQAVSTKGHYGSIINTFGRYI